MKSLDALRERLPEAARDLKLNLSTVLGEGTLSPAQRWGVAVATAFAARNPDLTQAVLADAREALGDAADDPIDDGRAAAVLMGMNNVYYRFRHLVGKPSYGEKPARLRMQRIAKPRMSKAEFELLCLAVSAINGCEACVRSHEQVVLHGGLTEDHVHDAVRIAATIHGVAVALELG